MSAHHESWELYRRAIDNVPSDLPEGDRAELYRSFSNESLATERIDDLRALLKDMDQ